MKKTILTALVLGLALVAHPQADNTKANRNPEHSVTAEDQSNAKSDVTIAKDIRSEITKDADLSTYAHNVKVIVKKGAVTLKGPVRSEEEKSTIETIAQKIAGDGKVTNELKVAKKGNGGKYE